MVDILSLIERFFLFFNHIIDIVLDQVIHFVARKIDSGAVGIPLFFFFIYFLLVYFGFYYQFIDNRLQISYHFFKLHIISTILIKDLIIWCKTHHQVVLLFDLFHVMLISPIDPCSSRILSQHDPRAIQLASV